jgi:hypothetical protein
MIFEWELRKSSYGSKEKGKRKKLVCPWQEAISIYFWVIGMSYYQKE